MSAAARIARAVRAGEISASDAVARAIAAIEACNKLNAVTDLHADRALERAQALEHARGTGQPLGPLAGVPFAVKNLFDVKGRVTRAGSRATDACAPAARDAFAIRALEAAGAILVASTNMDELAYGFSGENVHDGDCLNPRDVRLSPGGSSSGSAALVAVGAVPLALGTDTNGSVRVPAALCGVAGLKPTYGLISRSGVVPFVRSLDHVGIFATGAEDLTLVLEVLRAADPQDATQSVRPAAPAPPRLRVARLGGWFTAPLHADVSAALNRAAKVLDAGAEYTLPLAEEARAAAFVITTAEGGQQHLAGLVAHPDRFGPLVRDRLRAGALVPATWTGRAQKLRRMLCVQLAQAFDGVDALIAPATPCPAFPQGTVDWDVAGTTLPIRLGIGMFTQPLTLSGLPIAVMAMLGAQSGLPVGVQIIARAGAESTVLAAAQRLEEAGFTIPPVFPEAANA